MCFCFAIGFLLRGSVFVAVFLSGTIWKAAQEPVLYTNEIITHLTHVSLVFFCEFNPVLLFACYSATVPDSQIIHHTSHGGVTTL